MTPLAALAAAVRDRLLAGASAPLPGIGTLARAHVPARVRDRPDGERVLMPPGIAIGLVQKSEDPTDLAQALVRLTGAPAETAAAALRDAVDELEACLAVFVEVRLETVGLFRRTSGGVLFAPFVDLVQAVNAPFEALAPVPIEPTAVPALPASPRPPVAPGEPDAVATLLDPIVDEPAEDEPAEDEPAEDEPVAEALPVEEATAVSESDAAEPNEPAGAAEPEADASAELFLDLPPLAETADASSFDDSFRDDAPDDAIAVPFGMPEDDLRDVLPPTPPDRDPSEPPDAEALADEAPSYPLPDFDGIDDARDVAEVPADHTPAQYPDPSLPAAAHLHDDSVLASRKATWLAVAALSSLLFAVLVWWLAGGRGAAGVVQLEPTAAAQSAAADGPPPARAPIPATLADLPDADVRAFAGGTVLRDEPAWTWVVGWATSPTDAAHIAAPLQDAGFRTGVLTSTSDGRQVYLVAVGAFDSREQAIRLRDRLPSEAPPDTWLLDLRTL